jgi:hypothetical protein
MPGYQIVIDEIKRTSEAAQRVADGLRSANCSATLPGGDAGIPGAKAGPKFAAVKQALREREQGLTSRLEMHSANMDKAAQMYSGNEQAATRDMTGTSQPTSGPRPV